MLGRDPKPAAVVLPVSFGSTPRVYVVERADTMRDHAGELAFPGGKVEPDDADDWSAARRETMEEVGAQPNTLTKLGCLNPISVITGKYEISPFVANWRGPPPRATSTEVADIHEVELAPYVYGDRTFCAVYFPTERGEQMMPHFRLGDRVLYGASAVMLYELLEKISRGLGRTLPEPVRETELPWLGRYDS